MVAFIHIPYFQVSQQIQVYLHVIQDLPNLCIISTPQEFQLDPFYWILALKISRWGLSSQLK